MTHKEPNQGWLVPGGGSSGEDKNENIQHNIGQSAVLVYAIDLWWMIYSGMVMIEQ